MSASVVVIDPSSEVCSILERFFFDRGFRIRCSHAAEAGLALCRQEMPDLVLLDLALPDADGLEAIRKIKEMSRLCHVVVITAYDHAQSVVKAMKKGAEDYITKPLPMEELSALVTKLIGEPLKGRLEKGKGLDEILGSSMPMQKVYEIIYRIAGTSSTVLITGESGTGKELVARSLHINRGSRNCPFLSVNCASIPANLLEAELFGYEKGAFTDAKARKLGLIEVAAGGTLLLDEIGLMPLDLQAKLLTVLETRRFRRVGGTQEIPTEARFLAATNKDLEKGLRDGEFRDDLYYRLNVIQIHLPPLRVRGEDILLLSRHFLESYSHLHGTSVRELSEDAEALLMAYPWPGNIRELKNVIERAVLLTDGPSVKASDLSIYHHSRRISGKETATPVKVSETGLISIVFPAWGIPLEDLERQVIEEALRHTEGNVTNTARLLKISRDTLRYRMQKHGIKWSDQLRR